MAVKKYNIIFIIVIIILIFGIFISCSNAKSNQKILEGVDGPNLSTEMIAVANKLLVAQPVNLTTRWAVTFTIKLKTGCNGSWQQILGITPYKNGGDARVFGAWICPSQNSVHLRTATCNYQTNAVNTNAEITGCAGDLKNNIRYRFDITSNPTLDYTKQNIVVMMSNLDTITSTNPVTPPKSIQLANVVLDLPLYSPDNPFVPKDNNIPLTSGYIFSTYNNFSSFNGTISDVAYGTGGFDSKNAYSYANMINTTNYLASVAKQGFATMENSIKEGLDNIGGIGDNAGIKPISPPTNSVDVPPALNYKPVKSADGLKDLCAKSVVQPSDYKFNWISQYNFNYPIELGSDGKVKTSVPICSPDELYTIQSQVLKELNTFNEDYSDYMTYLYNYNHNVPGDTSVQLPYASGITSDVADQRYKKLATITSSGKLSGDVQNLDTYKRVIQDITTYNNLLKANQFYYPDPEKDNNNKLIGLSRIDPIILKKNHDDILKERNELDMKLFELNNIQNSAAGESKMQMDSGIYVTLLWTTLATSIIYFMFV